MHVFGSQRVIVVNAVEAVVHRPNRLIFILSFWGSKVHKNERFPAVDIDKPPCKI